MAFQVNSGAFSVSNGALTRGTAEVTKAWEDMTVGEYKHTEDTSEYHNFYPDVGALAPVYGDHYIQIGGRNGWFGVQPWWNPTLSAFPEPGSARESFEYWFYTNEVGVDVAPGVEYWFVWALQGGSDGVETTSDATDSTNYRDAYIARLHYNWGNGNDITFDLLRRQNGSNFTLGGPVTVRADYTTLLDEWVRVVGTWSTDGIAARVETGGTPDNPGTVEAELTSSDTTFQDPGGMALRTVTKDQNSDPAHGYFEDMAVVY